MRALLLSAVLLGAVTGSAQTQAPVTDPSAAVLATDADQERFLREAKIVRTRDTSKGVTASTRATLTDGTVTHDAHIQTIDESKREFRTATGVEFDFRDSWTYNIAAYRIDRLLGLQMVPVSVARTHRGMPAAFTWWVDDVMMDEQERLKKKAESPDRTTASRHTAMMRLFDELIANVDRNMGNMVYTRDWRLWLIDHTRAFRTHSSLRKPELVVRCERRVFERLKALDRETLKREVGKHLNDGQIKSLLARRDLIVKKLDSYGPAALFDGDRVPVTAPMSFVTPPVPGGPLAAELPYILGISPRELALAWSVITAS